ncbi:MHYT domain-containing protein [Streptomyces sp. NPDC049040]|uniref:MHYT domain-containing protein n=1 Tax=Streptomyces sp. NPDC049040 TaxID=3365593 RepID=UPI00371CCCAF
MSRHEPLWSDSIYPLIAYLIALTGSSLGLSCARRVQLLGYVRGRAWLTGGAFSLGTGIWGMHFVAMLGYRSPGAAVRYDPVLTLLSWAVAVSFVGIGMLLVSRSTTRSSLLCSGLLAGAGIAAMHYLGMAALRMAGRRVFEGGTVALSVVIAVVAATAALWATLRLTSRIARFAASLVMALAISGMHYTGMMSMTSMTSAGPATTEQADGMSPISVVVPLTAGLTFIIFVVSFAVLMNPVGELARELSRQQVPPVQAGN